MKFLVSFCSRLSPQFYSLSCFSLFLKKNKRRRVTHSFPIIFLLLHNLHIYLSKKRRKEKNKKGIWSFSKRRSTEEEGETIESRVNRVCRRRRGKEKRIDMYNRRRREKTKERRNQTSEQSARKPEKLVRERKSWQETDWLNLKDRRRERSKDV